MSILDTMRSAFIDNTNHRIVERTRIRSNVEAVRLFMACGLTMDCEPAWVTAPPVTLNENGDVVPWTIVFSENVPGPGGCPSCAQNP